VREWLDLRPGPILTATDTRYRPATLEATLLDIENPGGGFGRYVRYVWERPSFLTP
jgi:hypothetical protein